MNFDKLEQAIIRYRESLARFRRDREDLRAFGVTDLPGDAPTVAPKPAPGNLPGEPTEEMVKAAVCMLRMTRDATGEDYTEMRMALNAALAAAPRVEVPEVTEEDVRMAIEAWHTQDGLLDDQIECVLRNFRDRLIARMGAKS